VYGGGVAFAVYPHLWSSNTFFGGSSASAGDTNVSGLSAVFTNCHFTSCRAESFTASGTMSRIALFHLSIHIVTAFQTLDRS
jgi:hypothetical protein